jgi:hypothetical protein
MAHAKRHCTQALTHMRVRAFFTHTASSLTHSCTQVRDLLDDSISWMTLGQVRRVAPGEALGHLRADLLPPPTLGCPVTPLSAFPGQPVQVKIIMYQCIHIRVSVK